MAISRLKKAKERQGKISSKLLNLKSINSDNEYTAEKALPSVALALNAAGHHALNLAIWAECTVVPKLTEKVIIQQVIEIIILFRLKRRRATRRQRMMMILMTSSGTSTTQHTRRRILSEF